MTSPATEKKQGPDDLTKLRAEMREATQRRYEGIIKSARRSMMPTDDYIKFATLSVPYPTLVALLDALDASDRLREEAVAAEREAAAQAAEGPEFWPHQRQPGDVLTYRGSAEGNWLAVKPRYTIDPYSQGRADAAAAIRARSALASLETKETSNATDKAAP